MRPHTTAHTPKANPNIQCQEERYQFEGLWYDLAMTWIRSTTCQSQGRMLYHHWAAVSVKDAYDFSE